MKLTTSLLALLLMISATVEAAVIERDWRDAGDGLLTYDTVNQREWLDLTETQLFKFPGETLEERYQAVLVETLPGGVFGGFTPATRDDVFTLAESAGIDTTTTDFDANQVPVHQLISMVGMTATSGGNNNIHSIGFLSDQDRSRFAMEIVWGPAGRASAFAGLGDTVFIGSNTGAWLYRQIPEPTTGRLVVSVALIFFAAYRRF